MFKEPERRVMELWKLTAQSRLSFIHSDSAPSLNKVLESWPRIGDPKGYLLVSISATLQIFTSIYYFIFRAFCYKTNAVTFLLSLFPVCLALSNYEFC